MALCITTVVDSNYMAWLPAFVYCVNKAYPQYLVRLFVRDPVKYDLKLWRLKADIVPMFEDFPRYQYLSIALRFAIAKEYFKEFESVYVTDIDMMIMREHRDIEYFHEMEMAQTGLCYSNSIRNALHYAGSQSLTGLHYARREWFDRTDDLVAQYRDNMMHGILGLYREYDGLMLYRLAERCDLGIPGKYKLAARHHGIHMGNFRLFPDDRLKLEVRIPMDYRVQWMQHRSNAVFNEIVETCRADCKEMDEHIAAMDRFVVGK